MTNPFETRRALADLSLGRRRSTTTRPEQLAKTIIEDYERELRVYFRRIQKRFFAELEKDLDFLQILRANERLDQGNPVRIAVDVFNFVIGEEGGEDFIRERAEITGKRINASNRRSLNRQFFRLVQINPFDLEDVRGSLVGFIENNVSLVRKIENETRAGIQEQLTSSFQQGLRVEQISENLSKSFGFNQSRATLVARDQTLKFNSQITKERHRQVGVQEYTWITSRDGNVRPDHEVLDGTTQKWSEPPVVDQKTGRRAHPGEDFQCRCIAAPVIRPEEIFA